MLQGSQILLSGTFINALIKASWLLRADEGVTPAPGPGMVKRGRLAFLRVGLVPRYM